MRRRGAALIVAMLVLLMATATATFALQNTGYELRAAGSAKQAVQAKYVAESAVSAVMAWLEIKQEQNALATMLNGCVPPNDMMDPYYLPDLCTTGVDSYCFMTCDDIANDVDFMDDPLIDDQDVCGGGVVNSPYAPSCEVLLEYHCDQLTPTFGLLYVTASIFGKREVPAAMDFRTQDDGDDTNWGALEDRNAFHSSLSITRSYYTVSVTDCSLY